MTDRAPTDGFEARMTSLVRSYTEPAVTPIDAVLTARTAMASRTRDRALTRLWPDLQDRRLAWLVVLGALVVTITALAVAVGSRSSFFVQALSDPGRIVFVRDGDLFVAEGDGSGQSLIASGDAGDVKLGYLTAAWSPDMRHIAAVRDVGGAFLTPGVDLMTADGALVRTVALDPGCGPSVSWSPDSSEVAIATCPADVPRDAIEPVDSGIGLLIAGLDASADREIALPPEWGSVASANPEVWIRPELWARWSPDGRWIALPAMLSRQGVLVSGGRRRVGHPPDRRIHQRPGSASISLTGHPMGAVSRSQATGSAAWTRSASGSSTSEGGPVTPRSGTCPPRDPNLHGKLLAGVLARR